MKLCRNGADSHLVASTKAFDDTPSLLGHSSDSENHATQVLSVMNGRSGPESAICSDSLRPGRSAPSSDLLLVDENLDPAVAPPPARGAVIGNRLASSV